MNEREKLPNRRGGDTFEFEAGVPGYTPAHFVATTGHHEDGRLGEVFIHPTKTGSDRDISVQESALLLSFVLQLGGTIEMVRSAMPRSSGGIAEGPIGALLDRMAMDTERDRQASAQAKELRRAAREAQQVEAPTP